MHLRVLDSHRSRWQRFAKARRVHTAVDVVDDDRGVGAQCAACSDENTCGIAVCVTSRRMCVSILCVCVCVRARSLVTSHYTSKSQLSSRTRRYQRHRSVPSRLRCCSIARQRPAATTTTPTAATSGWTRHAASAAAARRCRRLRACRSRSRCRRRRHRVRVDASS
jgi:hypothetical protein